MCGSMAVDIGSDSRQGQVQTILQLWPFIGLSVSAIRMNECESGKKSTTYRKLVLGVGFLPKRLVTCQSTRMGETS